MKPENEYNIAQKNIAISGKRNAFKPFIISGTKKRMKWIDCHLKNTCIIKFAWSDSVSIFVYTFKRW